MFGDLTLREELELRRLRDKQDEKKDIYAPLGHHSCSEGKHEPAGTDGGFAIRLDIKLPSQSTLSQPLFARYCTRCRCLYVPAVFADHQ